MIHEMCRSIHLPENQIYRMCVASNTTMNHLFAGINADYLRTEPHISLKIYLHGAHPEVYVELHTELFIFLMRNLKKDGVWHA